MKSHACHMNNSFEIIFIKINIIKTDINKMYTMNIHIITKESNNNLVYKVSMIGQVLI